MCVAALYSRPGSARPLVLIHNRDEYHARPAMQAAVHTLPTGAIAHGSDRSAGGTWLAVAADGRVAFVMNHREGAATRGAESRGALPLAFVTADPVRSTDDYLATVRGRAASYAPFTLVAGMPAGGWQAYGSARDETITLGPGLHTVSNGGVDRSWPKERRLGVHLAAILPSLPPATHADVDEERLLRGLLDRTPAADAELPDTGIDRQLEQRLSPIFVHLPTHGYGTRASTLVIVYADGRIIMREWSFDASAALIADTRLILPPPTR
jgi:uncharacterized protein with NRDE domain